MRVFRNFVICLQNFVRFTWCDILIILIAYNCDFSDLSVVSFYMLVCFKQTIKSYYYYKHTQNIFQKNEKVFYVAQEFLPFIFSEIDMVRYCINQSNLMQPYEVFIVRVHLLLRTFKLASLQGLVTPVHFSQWIVCPMYFVIQNISVCGCCYIHVTMSSRLLINYLAAHCYFSGKIEQQVIIFNKYQFAYWVSVVYRRIQFVSAFT